MSELTQERLREVLDYNPENGVFTWKRTRRGVSHSGMVAGGKTRNGYRLINVERFRFTAHRLAFLYMTGSFPRECVDHINGDRDDNSWENLREVTYTENNRNKRHLKPCESGIVGVSYLPKEKRWIARINHSGRQHALGRYKTLFEAACARKSAELAYNYSRNHGKAA